MRFEFHQKTSRLLDLIRYPRVLFFHEEEKNEIDALIELIMKDSYKHFIDESIVKLQPYATQIKKYYQKDQFSPFDFVGILNNAFSMFEFEDEKVYFHSLFEKDEKILKQRFIQALLTVEEGNPPISDSADESQAFLYINSLKIEDALKWNLLMMIQHPKDTLRDFIRLLDNVKPFFDSYYEFFEKEVHNVGLDLVERLSSNPNQVFGQLTNQTISYDFTEYDTCHLYVSAIYPYTLSFNNRHECRIIWGMEMRETFVKLQELKEDQLTQRVKVFKALGDKTRYETLRLLARGVSSIKEIATICEVSSATISYHINEFLTSGIISYQKEKNQKSGYRIDYEMLDSVIQELRIDLLFAKQ